MIKTGIKNALLTLGTLIFSFALLEFVLQLREYHIVQKRYQGEIRKYKAIDPDLFLQVRPNTEFEGVNNHSFRGEAIARAKGPGAFRIFTLGGSTTLGTGYVYRVTYPALLKRKLEEAYPDVKIEVQNAAFDWYTTQHSIIRYLFQVRAFDPDVILFFEGINDLSRSFAPEWWSVGDYQPDYSHYWGPLIRLYRRKDLFAGYFPFGKLLTPQKIKTLFSFHPAKGREEQLSEAIKKMDAYDDGFFHMLEKSTRPVPVREFKSLPVFENNLRTLVRIIQADGKAVILGTQPFAYDESLAWERIRTFYLPILLCGEKGVYPDTQSMRLGMEQFNAATLKVAREMKVPVVDLAKAIPNTAEYFVDEVHQKPPAMEIVADLFFRAIRDEGVVEKTFQDSEKTFAPAAPGK